MTSNITIFSITGSCSDAVVALCAHIGLPIGIKERKLYPEALQAVNPQRTVPTLVDQEGLVLTETGAILNHIARQHVSELLGRGALERAHNEEMLGLLSTSVYSAFLLHFRPDRSADTDLGRAQVQARAPAAIATALDALDSKLQGRAFAAGAQLTTSDFLLLVMLNWAQAVDPALLDDRPRLKAQHQTLRAMPFHERAFAKSAA
ncbi:MAG: glutathione S-transferase family protein [Rhodoferax sp.]